MKFVSVVILTLVLVAPAHAGTFYLNDAAGLSGSFVCDDNIREAYWINSRSHAMRFTAATTWVGVQMKGKGDVWAFVERLSDRAPMTFVSWDHYAEPTGLHQFTEYFNPTFDVSAGDGLVIQYYCQSGVRKAHVIIKVQHQ